MLCRQEVEILELNTESLSFVSVIIPVYNDPEGIRTVVESLLNQTYPSDAYEVILVDNGSTDDTSKAIADFQTQYLDKVRSALENQIQNSYAARNKGISIARGEIFAFTDADCVPAADWLEAGVKALLSEGVSRGGGQIVVFYQSERPNVHEYYDSATKLQQKAYVDIGFAATANLFAYRHLFEKYGYFRDDLTSSGDNEFGRRLSKAQEKIIYIPNAVIQHPARSTFKGNYKKAVRLALGRKQLAQLGLLQEHPLTWQWLIPTRSYPVHPKWFHTLTKWEKLQLIFHKNLFRWLEFFIRAT